LTPWVIETTHRSISSRKLKILRHLLGFAFGITVFLILIPLGVRELSEGLDAWFGLPRFDQVAARLVFAIPLFACGAIYVLWSNLFLILRGKGGPAEGFGVAISPRTERLVVTGPYRNSRNPMVFGALSIYYSIALYLGSIGGSVILLLFSALIPLYLERAEEARLLSEFGEEYETYRKRVSMIVPLPVRKE
jgi:protein-S-isoprenylcysteine O-methyltransferase Ste14